GGCRPPPVAIARRARLTRHRTRSHKSALRGAWHSGSALPSHGRGHRFDPCRAHHSPSPRPCCDTLKADTPRGAGVVCGSLALAVSLPPIYFAAKTQLLSRRACGLGKTCASGRSRRTQFTTLFDTTPVSAREHRQCPPHPP